MSDFRHTTGEYAQREAHQSDQRPRSVNSKVVRSDDSLFTYDNDTITPKSSRSITADVVGDVTGNADTATNANNGVPTGTLIDFAGTSAPTGYLACDGAARNRITFAALFSVIGTTWGAGDGSTTFNVPNLQGAFTRGAGSHDTETMANGNAFAGPAVGSFEDDQMQGHLHNTLWQSFNTQGASQPGDGAKFRLLTITGSGVSSGNVPTLSTLVEDGVNGTPRTGDETRPFAAGVLKCIKT